MIESFQLQIEKMIGSLFRVMAASLDLIKKVFMISLVAKVKKSTPLRYDNNKIYGIKPYQYELTVVEDNNIQTCFNLEVKGISVGTRDDIIRVYITRRTILF